MSKHRTWKGHTLYESPDGRVATLDKERYDTYMATLDAAKAREKRRGALTKTAAAQQDQTATATDTTAPKSSGGKDKQ